MTETMGKYELRHVLGRGAMGTVYEGFDPLIARRVAIKTVRLPAPDDAQAQEELARFQREAQAAGRLSHPNIVGVYDYGETGELAYIVMEFIEGTTLKHLLDKSERFSPAAVVRLMDGLLAGLQYSHGRGVVHRDIKPANVMVTAAGEVKIADFGIARIESSSMTQAGTMLGTPAYMSPEQFMGQTVDARSDLYSAGVVLYQLLTGEKPFEGGLTAIMHKVLNTEPLAPSSLSVSVTPALDAVVAKAMAKRPDDRFASASAFATALRAALEAPAGAPGTGIGLQDSDLADNDATMLRPRAGAVAAAPQAGPARPPAAVAMAPAARRPSRLLLAGAGLAVLALLGSAAGLLLRPHRPAPAAPAMVAAAPSLPASPPAAPPLSQAARVAAFAETLGALPCTLLGADTSGAVTQLSGLAGAGAPRAALSAALSALPPGASYNNQIQTVDGPYCNALDTVRPYRPLQLNLDSRLGLLLAGGNVLHDGQLITLTEVMPGYAGYLQTDYFSSDGSVLHLYPTSTDPLVRLPAGSVKLLGDPKHGGATWQVSAPYGTDLIIAIASATPLFTTIRPADENASDYLPALRQALQKAASAGAQISLTATTVTTLAKGATP